MPPVPAPASAAETAPAIVLIDMDNTLADFDAAFASRWATERGPSVLPRDHFEMEQNFATDADRALALKIMATPGFYLSFQPSDGAVAAVHEMEAAGFRPFFCTAPHPLQYETCVSDKYAWVRRHFGEQFLERIIVTRDKTLVKGAFLIDDKPAVTGSAQPEWTHIVFTQPYNKHVRDVPRLNRWSEWRQVLEDCKPETTTTSRSENGHRHLKSE